MKQLDLFDQQKDSEPADCEWPEWRKKAWGEFIEKHPFVFHLLIVRDGIAEHHNILKCNVLPATITDP